LKRFSWSLAICFALLHLMTVFILGLMIFMNALGRAMAGMVVALSRARAPGHDRPIYETAFTILIQPAGSLIRQFDHVSTEWVFAVLAFNSLLWGIVISAMVAIFRKRRPKSIQNNPAETPILE
jgi:hypothetical protein